jgi:hypothetical protein
MNADGHLWDYEPERTIERESRGTDLSLVFTFRPPFFSSLTARRFPALFHRLAIVKLLLLACSSQ